MPKLSSILANHLSDFGMGIYKSNHKSNLMSKLSDFDMVKTDCD